MGKLHLSRVDDLPGIDSPRGHVVFFQCFCSLAQFAI